MESKGASLFPVAKGVQIPFVGKDLLNDASSGADFLSNARVLVPQKESKAAPLVQAKTAQNAGKDKRRFKDKSKGRLDEKYLERISDGLSFSSEVIDERVKNSKPYSFDKKPDAFKGFKKKKKKAVLVGRHDTRFAVTKHYPCFIKGPSESEVTFQPKSLPKIAQKTSIESLKEKQVLHKQIENISVKKVPLTWDEYLMTLLSKETAEVVIKEYTSGPQQLKLNKIIKNSPECDVRIHKSKSQQTDNSGAVQEENTQETQDKSSVEDCWEKPKNKSSLYSEQVKQGAMPVFKQRSNPNEIVLDTDLKTIYGKVLQSSFPAQTDNWYNWDSNPKKHKKTKRNKMAKGMHHWKDYPDVIDNNDVQRISLKSVTPTKSYAELDPKIVRKQREDANLVRIVEEWRSKWFLEKKWENSTSKELIDGMNDINDHVRLSAVSACSKALLNKKIVETKEQAKNILLRNDTSDYDSEVQMSADIFEKILQCLSDRCRQVQVASAITLFALNRGTQKVSLSAGPKENIAKQILLETLDSGGAPEKWAAAQCLAYASVDDDAVINELIKHINSADLVKHSKSVKLLGRLSKESNRVQFMLAEQLNSSSWRDRVVACQVFPSLQGPLSKDVANKISHLMWNDWSKDVRTAAARALGRTGNGKLVHDKLRDRLTDENEINILDALRKIAYLGIMTGRLLPAFLKCLKSDYISIRLEAVKTVSAIRLSQDEVINELLKLANEERNWKVKAHCIKAIGLVAKPTDNVQEVLLWCLRYERQAAIRAEACRAICSLSLKSDRVISILQDRLVVEEDSMVLREVTATLNELGEEPTGDLTMIKAIQREVKRLCNRDNIADAIVNQDLQETFNENKQKYLMIDDGSKNDQDNFQETEKSYTSFGPKVMNKFDPILEGYKIKCQQKVRIPSMPDVPDSELQLDDDQSDSGNDERSVSDNQSQTDPESDHNYESENDILGSSEATDYED
ncbi:uncharacterized protein LOC135696366 [Rhopilema esculentum]|uniref:uncharacterized protein LOC135696366 n=1 Tax=Rhopilema esculentum TaxID=499914 RepID=UPI0031DDAF5E